MTSRSDQDKPLGNEAESASKPLGSSLAFKAFLWLSVALGVGLLLAALLGAVDEASAGWLLLTILAGLTSSLGVRLPIGRSGAGGIAATLADCFTMLAMLLFGWKAAVLATAADGLAASLRFGTKSPMRIAFNIAQMCLTTFLTAQLFWSLHGGGHPLEFSWPTLGSTLALLLIAIAFSFAFNSAMISTAIGLHSGVAPGELARSHLVKLSPMSLAALAAAVAIWSPLPRPVALPLAVALLTLGWAYARWVRSSLAA